jgi:hypothetical protein
MDGSFLDHAYYSTETRLTSSNRSSWRSFQARIASFSTSKPRINCFKIENQFSKRLFSMNFKASIPKTTAAENKPTN